MILLICSKAKNAEGATRVNIEGGQLCDRILTIACCVLQNFAENTMNELLGWYGYDKVELRDSDNLDIGETPQHISVLKGTLQLFIYYMISFRRAI